MYPPPKSRYRTFLTPETSLTFHPNLYFPTGNAYSNFYHYWWVLPVVELCIHEIIPCVKFYAWLLLVNIHIFLFCPYLWHVKFLGPEVKLAPQQWPKRLQCWHQIQILNPLSRARDRTQVLMDTSQIRYHWAAMGTPNFTFKTPGFQSLCINCCKSYCYII